MIGPKIGASIASRIGIGVGSAGDSVVVEPPTLSLAITESAAAIPASTSYSYSVVLTVSDNPAVNVEVEVTLPTGSTFGSGSGTGWTVNHSTGVVTCTRSSASVGAAPTITINLTAPATTQIATCDGTANATGADEATAQETTQIAAAPTWVANGAQASSTAAGTLQVNYPAVDMTSPNKIALLIMAADDGTGVQSFSSAQGFVEVPDSPQGTGGAGGTRLRGWWCRPATASPTGPTFADVASDDHKTCQIMVFDGCVATGNPWDVTAGDVLAIASTAATVPGDTTTRVNTLAVAICTHDIDTATLQFSNWANASLVSCTERADVSTTLGAGGGFGVACGVKTAAGVVGNTTADVGSSVQARLFMALRSY